ncbi:aldehyde dehydrogenase family protein [Streptomyces sp. NPDC050400]|uniref:aldehyde dehydrogenase family protein n=1 Tax=Streptomyces sp. NPDC050400 TaxID=3365610 RepID=UPI0037BA9C5A
MLQDLLKAADTADIVDALPLVAGTWGGDGPPLQRTGPYLRRTVSRAPAATPADIAHALQHSNPFADQVASLAPAARADILQAASHTATAHRERLARLLALELGKPLKDSRTEIDRVAATFAVCAAEARRIDGENLPVAGWDTGIGNTALTYRAPAGVALAITPFNAPANLLAHKLGASFAAGNTTLVKAPPQAPAISTAIVALLLDSGMPHQAVQLLHGGGDVGAALCAAEEVSVISFTGSAATGAAVARAAGAKRLALELGGNAATIVCDDADIEAAAALCAKNGYSNSGQSCISVQRVYVHRSRFDTFLDAFTAAVDALKIGDPLEEHTDIGSMVDEDAAERVVQWSKEAAGLGARVVRGGTRDGATAAPTIIAAPPAHASVVVHEVFGALVAVIPYDDFGTVLDACNASRYGLQAGLFTHDVRRILTSWRRLQVGALIVNGSSNYRLDHIPFGGVKDSGFGREAPRWLIDDYTVVKTLMLRGLSVWGEHRELPKENP